MNCDFTCAESQAPSHINQNNARTGAAADTAETNKQTKYANQPGGSRDYEIIGRAVVDVPSSTGWTHYDSNR